MLFERPLLASQYFHSPTLFFVISVITFSERQTASRPGQSGRDHTLTLHVHIQCGSVFRVLASTYQTGFDQLCSCGGRVFVCTSLMFADDRSSSSCSSTPLAPPKTALCLFSIEANHFRTDKPICLLRGAVNASRGGVRSLATGLAWPGMVCHLFLHPIRVTSRKPSLVWIHLMYRSSRRLPTIAIASQLFRNAFFWCFQKLKT